MNEADVVVIGAGPAGVMAALRAADLGAKTTLISRGAFGGMAANDGPVPVRTLAHAARLAREARQLSRYGITVRDPSFDYERLLARARDVVEDARAHSMLHKNVDAAGIELYEYAGKASFVDPHTVQSQRAPETRGESIVICSGGVSRQLAIPGFENVATPADAFGLTSVPTSLIVIGAGATGVQVASIFNAFGSMVQLFEQGPRIAATEDEEVSLALAQAFREDGIIVREDFGVIDWFEATSNGVTMTYTKNGVRESAEAALVVSAVGWVADTIGLNLTAVGVETNARGYIEVDEQLRTSVPHIFAAGDVTGRKMLVPQAAYDGYVAGTNAVSAPPIDRAHSVDPVGSFTDPEYARVGLTEREARVKHNVLVSTARYDETTRPIIDGRTRGFCKLVIDRSDLTLVGCHVIGERAVEIAQIAAVAMAGKMPIEDLVRIPLSFPTYANVFGRAVVGAAQELRPSPATDCYVS